MSYYELDYKDNIGVVLKPSQILDVKMEVNEKGDNVYEVDFTRGDGGKGSIRCSDIPKYLKDYLKK